VSKTFTIASAGPKGRKAADAEDIAARYLVYKLYDASRDQLGTWQELRALGEPKANVDRAAERGWITVRQDGEGRAKVFSASLTAEGRRLAVRSRR
jgi:hypothetical protein